MGAKSPLAVFLEGPFGPKIPIKDHSIKTSISRREVGRLAVLQPLFCSNDRHSYQTHVYHLEILFGNYA